MLGFQNSGQLSTQHRVLLQPSQSFLEISVRLNCSMPGKGMYSLEHINGFVHANVVKYHYVIRKRSGVSGDIGVQTSSEFLMTTHRKQPRPQGSFKWLLQLASTAQRISTCFPLILLFKPSFSCLVFLVLIPLAHIQFLPLPSLFELMSHLDNWPWIGISPGCCLSALLSQLYTLQFQENIAPPIPMPGPHIPQLRNPTKFVGFE